jgi:hypothetical protein
MSAPSLDFWSERRSGLDRREVATARLARMPTSVTKHGVDHGMPYADKNAYKGKHSNREINGRIDQAPVRRVPLDGLHAIQHSVRPGRVLTFINDPGAVRPGTHDPEHGGIVDHPIVIHQDGVNYLHDGHHRVTAARLLGDKDIEARYVDFDQKG